VIDQGYQKRATRERIKTLLIGLGIGCALSAMLLMAKYRLSQRNTTPTPATTPADSASKPILFPYVPLATL
jgi:hypothetical protein